MEFFGVALNGLCKMRFNAFLHSVSSLLILITFHIQFSISEQCHQSKSPASMKFT